MDSAPTTAVMDSAPTIVVMDSAPTTALSAPTTAVTDSAPATTTCSAPLAMLSQSTDTELVSSTAEMNTLKEQVLLDLTSVANDVGKARGRPRRGTASKDAEI
jgi:hypothetical protein